MTDRGIGLGVASLICGGIVIAVPPSFQGWVLLSIGAVLYAIGLVEEMGQEEE